MTRRPRSILKGLPMLVLVATVTAACTEAGSTGSDTFEIDAAEVGLVFDEVATIGDDESTAREATVVLEIGEGGLGQRDLGATDEAGNATRIEVRLQIGEETGAP